MGQGNKRNAFILGATGAVGQQLLRLLVDSEKFAKIHAPARRDLPFEHKRLVRHPFEALYQPWNLDGSVSDFFYCFGSTLKQAGDKQRFRELELSVAHEARLVAKQMGAQRFFLVSAQGVDPHSLFFYLRVKAEVEKVLKDHLFRGFYVYRPSLLIAQRPEVRLGELVAQRTLRPLLPWLQRYAPGRSPVRAAQVAHAMLTDSLKAEDGFFVRENRQIIELASLTT